MMACAINGKILAATLLLSHWSIIAAKGSSSLSSGLESDGGGLRRRRGGLQRRHIKPNNVNANSKNRKNGDVMRDEDVAFWTRLLQGGSMQPRPPSPRPPTSPRPPAPTPPTPLTPFPTFDNGGGSTDTPATEDPTPAPQSLTRCGITESERRSQITDLLSTVSFPDLFDQDDTPQRRALDWIIDADAASLCPDSEDERIIQRYTLATFYYSTDGDSWRECGAPSNLSRPGRVEAANAACTLTTANATSIFPNDIRGTNAWLTPSNECSWGGVSCYGPNSQHSGRVNVVEFENNGLAGTLPEEMEQLEKMRFFALERGAIRGTIPAGYGRNLRELLLLDFDFNRLRGELPDTLWSLTNLRQLDLNDNRLSGELSGDIGNLRQLRFFQIDNNRMVGAIPNELGDIPNMSLIGLSGNDFTGAMPSNVCDLRPNPLQTLVVDCDIECDLATCCTGCVSGGGGGPTPTTPRPTNRPTPQQQLAPNPSTTTPRPTNRPTPRRTNRPTPPSPPSFNCPPTSMVGCTAADPSNFEDECSTLGEPCVDGFPGEFCCRDACPRNYCTAKEAVRQR